MTPRALAGLAFTVSLSCASSAHAECSDLWDWLQQGCRRVADTWKDGREEILVSGYSYHIPATWTPERRAQLNERAWGGGYGRTVEEPNGDTHTVFYLGFLDSHRNWESNLGYSWSTFFGPRDSLQLGLGYTAMIVQRPDIAAGVPFPTLLPLLTFRYGQANMVMTYIPALGGGINHGSTLYVFGRYTFDSRQ
jgi:palmitoyl transferase